MIAILIYILFVLLIAGFFAWLVKLLFPADSPYKTAALGVLGLIVFLIVISLLWPLFSSALHLGAAPVVVHTR